MPPSKVPVTDCVEDSWTVVYGFGHGASGLVPLLDDVVVVVVVGLVVVVVVLVVVVVVGGDGVVVVVVGLVAVVGVVVHAALEVVLVEPPAEPVHVVPFSAKLLGTPLDDE